MHLDEALPQRQLPDRVRIIEEVVDHDDAGLAHDSSSTSDVAGIV
jgi:hypothetical protein